MLPSDRKMQTLIRQWVPQGLRDFYNVATGRAIRFNGRYACWEDAEHAASGYADDALLQRIEAAALAVKHGEAAWEQDGFTHHSIPADWPTLACLTQVALANDGALTVVDFGGGLGSSYLQASHYLTEVYPIRWHIVEQPWVVASGRKYFQCEQLRFHDSLTECLTASKPMVIFLSAVLQYLPKPYELLERLVNTTVEFVIIDRHPETMTHELLTVQKLPPSMYCASYPSWLFEPHKLDGALSKSFAKQWEWSGKDPPMRGRVRGRRIGARFVGHFWRRRHGT